MHICLFNLKSSVYICQGPVAMLRLQTYRSPIPTLKMPIIWQGNQGMNPHEKHLENILSSDTIDS